MSIRDLIEDQRVVPLIATGGAVDEQLTKASGTDADVEWAADPAIDIGVETVVGTTNEIDVDSADPANPVVSISANYVPVNAVRYPLYHVQDQKASGIGGGDNTGSAWNDRDLNTPITDEGSFATLSSNEVTLLAGTYYIEASAPGYKVGRNKLAIKDTLGTILLTGANVIASLGYRGGSVAWVCGRLVLGSDTTIKLSQYTSNHASDGDLGLGVDTGIATEIYSDLKIWKIDEVL